jgi:hypothetical protein
LSVFSRWPTKRMPQTNITNIFHVRFCMNALTNFYEQQVEPVKGCLLALRSIILNQDSNISKIYL